MVLHICRTADAILTAEYVDPSYFGSAISPRGVWRPARGGASAPGCCTDAAGATSLNRKNF
eukprot:7824360-Pyramimonas_sp.AAC.1